MTNNNLKISPVHAREIALKEAGLDTAVFTWQTVDLTGEIPVYELRFTGGYMSYLCYVNTIDGSVIGFDCSPMAA